MIPTTITDVTSEWLASILSEDPTWAGYRFEGPAEELNVGFAGSVSRLRLARDDERGKRSLIVKLASTDEDRRRQFTRYGFYEAEVGFYRDLAADVGISVPHAYFAEYDPETNRFAIVLDDLDEQECALGADLAGCDLADAERVVRALAMMHARWWGDPALGRLPWLQSHSQRAAPRMDETRDAWSRVRDSLQDQLSPYAVKALDALMPRLERAFADMDGPTPTLTHGDFRLDNLCLSRSEGLVTAFDWQGVARGNGTRDLWYFVNTSPIAGAEPDALWEHLAGAYHDELVRNGVADYSLDGLLEDSRLNSLHFIVAALNALANFDLSSDRGVAVAARGVELLSDRTARFGLLEMLRGRYAD